MTRGFFADVLTSRPFLWERMVRSNSPHVSGGACAHAAPCAQEASALLGEGAPGFLAWLGERSPARGHARTAQNDFWDYVEESRRLALLDAETLARLCLVAGVAFHAADIAHVLHREQVQELRRAIGETLYTYALYRGQYQVGTVSAVFAELHTSLPLEERCRLHGSMAPRLVAARWPEELAARFLPVLPALPEGTAMPALDEAETLAIWHTLKKLLLKEVTPSWAPCFE